MSHTVKFSTVKYIIIIIGRSNLEIRYKAWQVKHPAIIFACYGRKKNMPYNDTE